MSFGPRIQKQEGVLWPKEGYPVQKVILLIPGLTLDDQQGGGFQAQGAPPSILFLGGCGDVGYTGEARDRSFGSTTKIRLPEHEGDDVELKKDTIEDPPLRQTVCMCVLRLYNKYYQHLTVRSAEKCMIADTSVGQRVKRFWLRVSHEVTINLSAEDVTKAGHPFP